MVELRAIRGFFNYTKYQVRPSFVFQVGSTYCTLQSTSPPSSLYRIYSGPEQREACRDLAITTAQDQGTTCVFY